jgi:hypothetical protein
MENSLFDPAIIDKYPWLKDWEVPSLVILDPFLVRKQNLEPTTEIINLAETQRIELLNGMGMGQLI